MDVSECKQQDICRIFKTGFKTFFKTCTNKINTIWAGKGNVYDNILICKMTVQSMIYISDSGFHKNKTVL